MAFTDFDLDRVQRDFGLTLTMVRPLFADVAPVPVSAGLAGFWALNREVAVASMRGRLRSALLVAPLLSEVWHRSDRRVVPWSGVPFDVDPGAGLAGECDFVLGRAGQTLWIEAPALVVTVAKRDTLTDGYGPCAAGMVAAARMNERGGTPQPVTYGCVTTGVLWCFLTLGGRALAIDVERHTVTADADKILGIVLHCCGVAA